MTELELTRVPHDRRLYSLAGVGTVRLTGLLSHAAGAQADEQQWRIARRGVWRGGRRETLRAPRSASSTPETSAAAARFAGRAGS